MLNLREDKGSVKLSRFDVIGNGSVIVLHDEVDYPQHVSTATEQ